MVAKVIPKLPLLPLFPSGSLVNEVGCDQASMPVAGFPLDHSRDLDYGRLISCTAQLCGSKVFTSAWGGRFDPRTTQCEFLCMASTRLPLHKR